MPSARTTPRATPRGARTASGGKPSAEGRPRAVKEERSRFSRAFSRVRSTPKASGGRLVGLGTSLRELRNELRKVEWPTREQAVKLTAAVIGLSGVVGVFLGGVDFIFQELFRFLLELTSGV
jgi:preprotein translocase subunit SecE